MCSSDGGCDILPSNSNSARTTFCWSSSAFTLLLYLCWVRGSLALSRLGCIGADGGGIEPNACIKERSIQSAQCWKEGPA